MRVIINFYDTCKYEDDSKVIAECELTDIASFKVKKIPASEILRETDGSCFDYNKYTVLTFENGETRTYRNCYVDIFRLDWLTSQTQKRKGLISRKDARNEKIWTCSNLGYRWKGSVRTYDRGRSTKILKTFTICFWKSNFLDGN